MISINRWPISSAMSLFSHRCLLLVIAVLGLLNHSTTEAYVSNGNTPGSGKSTSPTAPVAVNGAVIKPTTNMKKLTTSTPSSASVNANANANTNARLRLSPPFPNGLCGGSIVTIPPEETFGIDINLANINVGGNLILPPRPIQVWLPPNYYYAHDGKSSTPPRRHPTLYVHDGQNAILDSDSWTGTSWRLAGCLTRMAEYDDLLRKEYRHDQEEEEDGMASSSSSSSSLLPIVVMIPSVEGDFLPGIRRRHLEYGDSNLPFSQAHADFVAKTVKPMIDNRFRTMPEAEHTFAMGSSLGGQASLHLMLRHPNSFGGVACLSPFFGPSLIQEIANNSQKQQQQQLAGKRVYLDIGGDLNDVTVPMIDIFDHLTSDHWWNPGYFWLDTQLQSSVISMKDALQKAGIHYQYKEFPGGRHNERAWAQRVHEPLLHLFGNNPPL